MQNKLFNILKRISVVKTIRFNLRYLPIKQAIGFPIIVARKVRISNLKQQFGNLLASNGV